MNKDFIYKVFNLTKDFIKELFEPKISFYAASMSWATLFFIIPLFVIVFSIILHTPIFKEYYQNIHTLIGNYLVPTNSKIIMNFIDSFVQNASKIGFIGLIYVVIAAIFFFRDFDYIVNDIFKDNRRSLLNTIILYGALILFIPLFVALSFWLYIFISKDFAIANYIMQFFIFWMITTIIYKVTPKDKIPFKIASISAFIATLVWFIAKSIFVFYILYNKTYTTIYGTISIIMFMFLWIYISWAIFLHGLQLCNLLIGDE